MEEYIAQCPPDLIPQIRKRSDLCTTSKTEISSLTSPQKTRSCLTSTPVMTPRKGRYSMNQIDQAKRALDKARRWENLSTKDTEILKLSHLILEQYELDKYHTLTLKQAIEIVKKSNPSFRIGTPILKTKIQSLLEHGKYERSPKETRSLVQVIMLIILKAA